MSIDIDWNTLTKGPDGDALAESIRAFVHDKFQSVQLPRMIRSVNVHSFDFGSSVPVIELKDVCDPLQDFYEDDDRGEATLHRPHPDHTFTTSSQGETKKHSLDTHPLRVPTDDFPRMTARATQGQSLHPPRSPTSRFTGGTSNLGYFHLPMSGLSGTSTPLAAVAGARFQNWPRQTDLPLDDGQHATSFGSISPPSTLPATSRPTSRHQEWQSSHSMSSNDSLDSPSQEPQTPVQIHEAQPNDLQVVAHISYNGDVKLNITAEILLDYPMPSFVGIPLQLNITGLTFDGIGILAYIKKRIHFCFVAPEDVEAILDPSDTRGAEHPKIGTLIEEIRVESEIGQKDGGKQVLKNVGKVEKFILEQVRKIFEDEFVYPSFWTLLV